MLRCVCYFFGGGAWFPESERDMIILENIHPCSPKNMSILGMIGSRMPVSTSGGMLSMPAAPPTTSSATIDTQGKRLLPPIKLPTYKLLPLSN